MFHQSCSVMLLCLCLHSQLAFGFRPAEPTDPALPYIYPAWPCATVAGDMGV